VRVALREVVEIVLSGCDVAGTVGERVIVGFVALDVREITLFEGLAERVLCLENVVDVFLVGGSAERECEQQSCRQ
jgi:hypothetical protein